MDLTEDGEGHPETKVIGEEIVDLTVGRMLTYLL